MMINELHFLRPWWFLCLLPLFILVIVFWRQPPSLHAWSKICDSHLLNHLLKRRGQNKRLKALLFLFLSAFFMIISLTGPAWQKLPAPIYKIILPRVLLLDMSSTMLNTDLSPDRLSRAKFKLHDLFNRPNTGQFALIAFTEEPFVVSPLTDDAKTISALLPALNIDIMPIGGQNLNSALKEAHNLIQQGGYEQGQILIMTANPPSNKAIETAEYLAEKGIITSILPITAEKNLNPLYQQIADAGQGKLLSYTTDTSDLIQWMKTNKANKHFMLGERNDVPLWRDEGRWFLIPALLFLLPLFQRGWLQRITV